MKLKYGPIRTPAMANGSAMHKFIEHKATEGEIPSHISKLKEAVNISNSIDAVIQSVERYYMQYEVMPNVFLIGKPDYIGAYRGNVIITERKPYRDRLLTGELMQVASYALLAHAETGLDYNKITCYIDKYDRETGEIIKREHVIITEKLIDELLLIINDIVHHLKNNSMPDKGTMCEYCPYKEMCD